MRNRLARKMAAEMRGATCAGTQTSKAPTLSGPSVTNHYSVAIVSHGHRIGKEQKAHSFDLFDAAATRRNARAPTAAMLLARSSQPDQ